MLCAQVFALGAKSGTQQIVPLSCAALKSAQQNIDTRQAVCRVPPTEHMAKANFAECCPQQRGSTRLMVTAVSSRQPPSDFAVSRVWTHDKVRVFVVCLLLAHGKARFAMC